MTDHELISRYRNLLINLARQKEQAIEESEAIALAAKIEPKPGRRAGLQCKAKSLRKHAAKLEMLLSRNNAASLQFFGTSNQKKVAEQDVIYAQELLTAGQPLLTSSQQHANATSKTNRTASSG